MGPHERLHRTAAEYEARRRRLAVQVSKRHWQATVCGGCPLPLPLPLNPPRHSLMQAAREEMQGLPSEPAQRHPPRPAALSGRRSEAGSSVAGGSIPGTLSPQSGGGGALASLAAAAGEGSAALAGLVRKNEDLVARARQVRSTMATGGGKGRGAKRSV